LAKKKKKRKGATRSGPDGIAIVARNRRAHHDYEVGKTFEAGLVLTGSEVKSLRDGDVQWADAHASVERGEAWLFGLYIGEYRQASYNNHLPTRTRKLLLHRREINQLIGALQAKGMSLVPLQVHFKRGNAKILLALAKGKKKADKKRDLIRREKDRDIERAMARRR